MIAGVSYLAIGLLVTLVGWRHWRYRNEETISVLQAGISKLTGQEPLPRTRLDRLLGYGQAVSGFVLGPIFALLGVFVLLNELGLL